MKTTDDWKCSCGVYNSVWNIACQGCGKRREKVIKDKKFLRLESQLPTDVQMVLIDHNPSGFPGDFQRWVPLSKYLELMEKFEIVNFEYTKLGNMWMAFAAQKRPTQLEVGIMELRGEKAIRMATMFIQQMNDWEKRPGWRGWKFRLGCRIWAYLTGHPWVAKVRTF